MNICDGHQLYTINHEDEKVRLFMEVSTEADYLKDMNLLK